MATSLQLQAPSHCLCNNKAIFPSTLLPKGKFNYRKCNPKSNFSSRFRVRAVKEKTEEIKNPPSAEDITKKYGLEAGLWKVPFLLYF